VGHIYCIGYREASPLNLGIEHVPFPCSLRELVLDRFAEAPGAGGNAHPLKTDEIIGYLKEIDDFSISPWIAITEKTEAIGDPASPSREHTAILRWLGKGLEIWEKEYPLEGRLANQVRRLKPLAAALAITDPQFLTPGAHPVHQLLDHIQARAIGWQSRLERVGAALEEQITRAVDKSRHWFEDPGTELNAICREFTEAAERDQTRARRMVQRVVETEAGKVRTAAAKQEAARMINAFLQKYPAPADIGEFIKGPWYTSAQLLLLKFGLDSEQWRSMSATTETLLNSMQSIEDADEERRQHIFTVVTQLPKEMRHCLLSLHHDTDAVNEAMGLVEFTHLRILRQQPVELQNIDPIVVEDEHLLAGEARHSNALKKWSEGQWFMVEQSGSGLRAQLVLKIEQSQQLLFTNMAGIKVLQLSYEEFNKLLLDKKVTPLHSGASFSLSLAQAAGVNSVEILTALTNAMGADLESQREPEPEPEPEPEAQPQSMRDTVREPDYSDLAADFLPAEDAEALLPVDESPEAGLEAPALADLERDNLSLDPVGGEDLTADQPGPTDAAPEADTRDPDRIAFEKETRRFLRDEDIQASEPEEQEEVPERAINLPVGVWIGFHDGDTPTMARLAVYDPEEDHFIFVNRKGMKIRQISRQEFLDLIDNNLVEILEANSNFREAVSEIRKTRK